MLAKCFWHWNSRIYAVSGTRLQYILNVKLAFWVLRPYQRQKVSINSTGWHKYLTIYMLANLCIILWRSNYQDGLGNALGPFTWIFAFFCKVRLEAHLTYQTGTLNQTYVWKTKKMFRKCPFLVFHSYICSYFHRLLECPFVMVYWKYHVLKVHLRLHFTDKNL